MLTINEFLRYFPKRSTYLTYQMALQRYLHIITDRDITRENMNAEWARYMKNPKQVIPDLVYFPTKCKLQEQPLSPKSVHLYWQTARMYLLECGLEPDKVQLRLMKKTMPKNRSLSREQELTKDDVRTIVDYSELRLKAEILIAASSGLRIGELVSITFNDLNLKAVPAEIYVQEDISKNSRARVAFMSNEAKVTLEAWLGVREGYVKRKRYGSVVDQRVFPYTITNEIYKLTRILRRAGYHVIDHKTGRTTIHFHSFRKFFLTEFKLAASHEVAEELAGHEGYLSRSYRRLNMQTMREEYLKAEPALTIYDNLYDALQVHDTDHPLLHQELCEQLDMIQEEIARLRAMYWAVQTQMISINPSIKMPFTLDPPIPKKQRQNPREEK